MNAALRDAATSVGFSELRIADGEARPLVAGVWHPSDAPARDHPLRAFVQTVVPGGAVLGDGLPLVVVSHGTGGSYDNHYDTALALAKAGFVVAAVSHAGDTDEDQSRALVMTDRSRHIHRLIDHMLGEWPGSAQIDADRVGMFGFSSGGYTALVAVGGIADPARIAAHRLAHPDYFDAKLYERASLEVRAEAATASANASASLRDVRIKAAVVAAPAIGYAFRREGLQAVTVPIQLWRAEHDHILPNPDYAEAVRLALPAPPEFHLVENADHFDFLAPCTDLLRQFAPQICVSRPGFDRARFHQTFNREVVRFFRQTLMRTRAV
jgi:predicted dienelactone hydrolase